MMGWWVERWVTRKATAFNKHKGRIMKIEKAVVIGSGVMGSQIAAQIANAGVPVLLLDIVPKDAADRSMLAKGALDRLLKMDPAPLMHPGNARFIACGNLEDDLDKVAEADWIIEAVLEDPKVKAGLYTKIDWVRKPGSVVSSNTSTIPLAHLVTGQSEAFARDFLITHFFNPPRYMRLLELIAGPNTRADALAAVRDFVDVRMGKGVVVCHDTPGFIANRIGANWMQAGINAALDFGLSVEEADAVAGKPMGLPKTGVFGLLDLIGIDLMPLIAKSLLAQIPADDPYRALYRWPDLFGRMVADGYTGRKGKGGFYRLNRTGTEKVKEAIDLKTGEYRPAGKVHLASLDGKPTLRKLAESTDKGGQFAWALLSDGLSYAADLVPEIADDIVAVDAAMRLGYNWKHGPFEMMDLLGTDWFAAQLAAKGKPVPKMLALAAGRPFYRVENGQPQYLTTTGDYAPLQRPDGVLLLADLKRSQKPLAKNGSACLWDIGDGVVCLEFTSKMNTLDPDSFAIIGKAVGLIGDGQGPFKALVIYNEGENFSAGANLGLALFALNLGLYDQVEALIHGGQSAYAALKYAPFPVVAAPFNLALGGGCEILLHCDAVQAHAELYTGLVEVGVGVVPGWGGCTQMLLRAASDPKSPKGPMPPITRVFEQVGTARVSKSASDAWDMLVLRDGDGITMNRDRLLADAKAKALSLVDGYHPPKPAELRLPGPTARAALQLGLDGFKAQGKLLPYDEVVVSALADVLSGGDTDITVPLTERQVMDLELGAFAYLVRNPGTLARIEYMLANGKPLRN
jgi:3-hydroxyacyl-CoA dehydrogenase